MIYVKFLIREPIKTSVFRGTHKGLGGMRFTEWSPADCLWRRVLCCTAHRGLNRHAKRELLAQG